jgi:UDPglucose--hexose-1-phosphate uridylyltransferase
LPTGGDWLVRVVPNLYPAVERQEVVIHSPRHVRSFAELTDEEIELVASVVQSSNAFWLVNEGRAAGSSLPHSHSQLVYLDDAPPAVRAEDEAGVRAVLDQEELVVAQEDRVRVVAHLAGRLPYELLIASDDPELSLPTALRLLRNSIARLRAVEGPVPWNAWLHSDDHAHLEVVPRLTVMAALELGAGIYVNSLDPAEAAARLRSV